MPHHAHFDLNIPLAIRHQMIARFERLEWLPLREVPDFGNAQLPEKAGVYALAHRQRNGRVSIMYAGKAKNLRKRLMQHAKRISGRRSLTLDNVFCKCLTVTRNWAAYAPEDLLIKHLKSQGQCEWNGIGFGSNDPGRNRELTQHPPLGWHSRFPVRHDLPCDFVQPGEHKVLKLLGTMKKKLPFLLRFGSRGKLTGRTVVIRPMKRYSTAPLTVEQILNQIVAVLPGWQATRFPSHMILYPENFRYAHGVVMARNRSVRQPKAAIKKTARRKT